MRFAKQKFSIFLLFLALPLLCIFSLIENPVVSSAMLRLGISYARIRAGVNINAESWNINPVLFSFTLNQFEYSDPNARVQIRKVSVQLSPLSLALGKISLVEARVAGAQIQLKSKIFGASNSAAESKSDFSLKSVPQFLGKQYQKILDLLRENGIAFEEIEISQLSLDTEDLYLENVDLRFSNLGSGQARSSWELSGLGIKNQVHRIERLEGAAALLKRSGGQYSLSLGNFKFAIDEGKAFELQALGGFPGVLNLELKSKLSLFRDWARESPKIASDVPADLEGDLKAKFTLELGSGDELPGDLRLTLEKFRAANSMLQHLDLSVHFMDLLTLRSNPRIELKKGLAVLDNHFGANPNWKRQVDFSGLRFEKDALAGMIKLNEAGLCSILQSTGDPECYAAVGFSGNVQLQGSLKPLELRGALDLQILGGDIGSDPLVPQIDNRILTLKDGKLAGTMQVKEDRVHLDAVQILFPNSAGIDLSGDVVYSPTLVRLKARSSALNIQSVTDSVADLAFSGVGEVESTIFYDQKLSRVERTRVSNKLKIKDFGLDREVFGSVSGNLDYTEKSLRFGPLQIRSGGGIGRLSGSLANHKEGSYLDLELNMDRVEFKSSSDESGRPFFQGFLTGGARMTGYTAVKDGQSRLGADIELVARNFEAFGIPFQKANFSGTYRNRVLLVDSFRAIKDGAWLELNGELNPDGGSFIKFWSDKVPIRNVTIDPSLVIFDSGRVEVEGKWEPSKGWGLGGRLTELSLSGQPLPAGQMQIASAGETFDFGLEISSLLKFKMRTRSSSGGLSRVEEMEAALRDRGLYAGFAYLGLWTKPKAFETKGSLSFRWTPTEGFFKTNNLKVQGPVGETGRVVPLVDVPGAQEIVWKNRKLESNTLSWTGPSTITAQGQRGDSSVTLRGKVLAPFAGLFIPGISMLDGYFEGQAILPLSPHFDTLRLRGDIIDGSVLIPGFYEPFSNLEGRVSMQDAQVSLQDIRGSAGPGKVSLSGVYKLDSKKSGAALQADFQQARTVVLEDVPVDLTGSVNLTGENPPYLLSGSLAVGNAVYGKEFKSAPAASALAGLLKKDPFLKFDVRLEIGGTCRVLNSLISSNVVGEMRMTGSELEPLVGGEIDLKDGSIYANQNEFKISHGRVYIPADPNSRVNLNLRAQTEIKYSDQTYRIEMSARGSVDNLEIDLISDPPLGQPDIVSLLAFGVIREDETAAATTTQTRDQLFSAAQAEAFQSIFGRALGSSINKSTGFQVRLKAGEAQQAGKETLPNVTVVRKISDKVTAKFGRSLNLRNPEKDFQVDYELMKNINISGVWENQEENKTSLGVDLRFRIDIK